MNEAIFSKIAREIAMEKMAGSFRLINEPFEDMLTDEGKRTLLEGPSSSKKKSVSPVTTSSSSDIPKIETYRDPGGSLYRQKFYPYNSRPEKIRFYTGDNWQPKTEITKGKPAAPTPSDTLKKYQDLASGAEKDYLYDIEKHQDSTSPQSQKFVSETQSKLDNLRKRRDKLEGGMVKEQSETEVFSKIAREIAIKKMDKTASISKSILQRIKDGVISGAEGYTLRGNLSKVLRELRKNPAFKGKVHSTSTAMGNVETPLRTEIRETMKGFPTRIKDFDDAISTGAVPEALKKVMPAASPKSNTQKLEAIVSARDKIMRDYNRGRGDLQYFG